MADISRLAAHAGAPTAQSVQHAGAASSGRQPLAPDTQASWDMQGELGEAWLGFDALRNTILAFQLATEARGIDSVDVPALFDVLLKLVPEEQALFDQLQAIGNRYRDALRQAAEEERSRAVPASLLPRIIAAARGDDVGSAELKALFDVLNASINTDIAYNHAARELMEAVRQQGYVVETRIRSTGECNVTFKRPSKAKPRALPARAPAAAPASTPTQRRKREYLVAGAA